MYLREVCDELSPRWHLEIIRVARRTTRGFILHARPLERLSFLVINELDITTVLAKWSLPKPHAYRLQGGIFSLVTHVSCCGARNQAVERNRLIASLKYSTQQTQHVMGNGQQATGNGQRASRKRQHSLARKKQKANASQSITRKENDAQTLRMQSCCTSVRLDENRYSSPAAAIGTPGHQDRFGRSNRSN